MSGQLLLAIIVIEKAEKRDEMVVEQGVKSKLKYLVHLMVMSVKQ